MTSQVDPELQPARHRLWIARLRATDFRNYEALSVELDDRSVVLTGPNGAGKTNLLEAVSLLAPGRGLGRAQFADMIRHGAAGWALNAILHSAHGEVEIGTGYRSDDQTSARAVRINGETARSAGALGDYTRTIWLTPAMDGLFTGAAGERRRFLDRLIQSLDPGYRSNLSRFERAMRQRNRLLEDGEASSSRYEGFETQLAEAGTAIAATRLDTVTRLARLCDTPAKGGDASPFPWAELVLEGVLEGRLLNEAAVDVEDFYLETLARCREQDRAARRTLEGPHRSDLIVGHGPKGAPARRCSTGEQKALLIGLVLAHAELVKQQSDGYAPLILLDEIVAHLDEARREGLFHEIERLGAQAWMTGTDAAHFAPMGAHAQHFRIENGGVCA
ncbi:MAG: DNA replication/repair protein RecF [Hyphomicrobiaceae bacterium]|nr:DNA replication/repair protein RecF [Hyphomicrobiaceae bacterium]